MGRYNTGKEEMDLGFKVHEKGWYLFQIDEGAKVNLGTAKDEPDESINLQLPLLSVKALEDGDEEAVGGKLVLFIYLRSGEGKDVTFGENQIAQILTSTGLADMFEEKFGDDTPFTDSKFLDSVILKSQSKMFAGYVDHEPDYKDKNKTRAKLLKIKTHKKEAPAATSGEAGEDW